MSTFRTYSNDFDTSGSGGGVGKREAGGLMIQNLLTDPDVREK